MRLYPCPCCRFLTLPKEPPGTFDTCPVCYWVDDGRQYRNPSATGGANRVSLEEARKNFQILGAASATDVQHVRPPEVHEHPLGDVIGRTIPNCVPNHLLAQARSLSPVQPYEVGWSRSAAIELLQSLEGSNIPVLGADVYRLEHDMFRPTYVGWSCVDLRTRKQAGELAQSAYAAMSRARIMELLHSFADPDDGTILYTLSFAWA